MGHAIDTIPLEGVIQYQLDFVTEHHIDCPQFAELNHWRSYFHRLELIGQDPARYGGLGYGNVSHRACNYDYDLGCADEANAGQDEPDNAFVISGTQTGHLPLLCREHYVLVEAVDLERNLVRARGPIPPSSEALTHAALYWASAAVQTVFHVHSPLLWQRARQLNLLQTPPQVTYGTPAMALAVAGLVQQRQQQEGRVDGVIAMLGHEDGIIVYGGDVESVGALLLQSVMDAHDLDQHYFTHSNG